MKKIIYLFSFLIITIAGLVSCSQNDEQQPAETFVLVHGAWQGPYVWLSVKQQLEGKGHKVIVVELPAHGGDNTSPALVSIDVYRDKVISAMNAVNGKVILVGHSMGGVVVSAVAEKIPNKIRKLVYIGAFLPANGQSLLDLAFQDTQSQLGASLIPSKDQLTLDIVSENITSIFCQDGTDVVKQLVADKFRVEPAIPFTNKITLTANNFGRVDKYYVRTTEDHAIGINLQNQMLQAAQITKTYSLTSGHCPFLTQPENVANLFLAIAK